MINQVVFGGVINREPELKTTQTGKSMLRLSLENQETFRNGKTSKTFLDVTVWDEAEVLAGSLALGEFVVITGRLEKRSFEKGGQKVWVTEIGNAKVHRAGTAPAAKPAPQSDPAAWDEGHPLSADDIPF